MVFTCIEDLLILFIPGELFPFFSFFQILPRLDMCGNQPAIHANLPSISATCTSKSNICLSKIRCVWEKSSKSAIPPSILRHIRRLYHQNAQLYHKNRVCLRIYRSRPPFLMFLSIFFCIFISNISVLYIKIRIFTFNFHEEAYSESVFIFFPSVPHIPFYGVKSFYNAFSIVLSLFFLFQVVCRRSSTPFGIGAKRDRDMVKNKKDLNFLDRSLFSFCIRLLHCFLNRNKKLEGRHPTVKAFAKSGFARPSRTKKSLFS